MTTNVYSTNIADFHKVRPETVSLVNAASHNASGLGVQQAGISLQFPAENIGTGNQLFTRIFFISPKEIAKNTLDDAAIAQRLREVISSTPIRYDPKRDQRVFLDAHCREFYAMEQRLLPMIRIASRNFCKEIVELLAIFDGYTQPGMSAPPSSAFHVRAAFEYLELLNSYRQAHGGFPPLAPSLTYEGRAELTQRGISTTHIADRKITKAPPVRGLMDAALSINARSLRAASQGEEYGEEVQMIVHVLGEAIVHGQIPSLVMDGEFRRNLSRVIAEARMPHAAQSAMPANTHLPQ